MTLLLSQRTERSAAQQPRRQRFLHSLNPLAKITATLPATVALVALRDPLRPAMFLALALLLILAGASLRPRPAVLVFLGLPLAALVLSLTFGIWIDGPADPAELVFFQIGTYRFTSTMWFEGLTTALRLTAIVGLTLIAGLTMTGPDLVRALVKQGRLPYRVAYAGLAALRFVPRLRLELDVIRAAHRVRGLTYSRGPTGQLRRRAGYALPLMAGAIRHAERVSFVMDNRAFGAYPHRTERTPMPYRIRDTVFIVTSWAVTIIILIAPSILGETVVW